MAEPTVPVGGVTFPMQRGPYQNNGASPWYTQTTLGTPGQPLKFAIDTGTNMVWTTSTLCAPTSCQHYSGARFDYIQSSTYEWVDCIQVPFSFGPWGTMQVETGQDVLALPNGSSLPLVLYLSADYSGPQFAQLDWDGGIGIPSGSPYKQGDTSFIVQDMMNQGMISPNLPFVAFDWDGGSSSGNCIIGGYDPDAYDPNQGLFLPWTPYTQFAGVEYIWTCDLASYSVGGKTIATNLQFALDSGSSQFKGDNDLMNNTLQLIQQMGSPPVQLAFPGGGMITVTSDMYEVTIQAGPDQGQTLPQFQPLGLTGLALVGSVVMEYCYTIFAYRVVQCAPGRYSLAPYGMYVFNKPGGPQIVSNGGIASAHQLGQREVVRGKTMP
ncbi:pepsin-like aspartic protease [Sphingosinicella terrae]|uniref:pepsin-like aspartic protease n=1 Tax=Sphingosinicella terrae TaxID=2172047 RepID=UPI0013B45A8A|nr:pepsin-like aspartic protease [Sphingosinicella terrae]